MNTFIPKIIFGAPLAVLAVLLPCSCISYNPKSAQRKSSNELASTVEKSEEDIILVIFSLPAFQYHEETRESFWNSLWAAKQLPQNRRCAQNYLYCPGDGTFSPREFKWDQDSNTLTVLVHGDAVDPPWEAVWQRVGGKWQQVDNQVDELDADQ